MFKKFSSPHFKFAAQVVIAALFSMSHGKSAAGEPAPAAVPDRACIPNPHNLRLPSPPFCPPAHEQGVSPAPKKIPDAPGGATAQNLGNKRQSVTTAMPQPPPCFSCVPPNVPVDTNSDQTMYGKKSFVQPIVGYLDGYAAYSEQFVNELSGDVAGGQFATRIVNVPVSALPSIGFVPGVHTQVKYIHSDADPADPAMDGSIAHPYANIPAAAAAASNGDRFILQGSFSGSATFNAAVSLEGAGPSQTVIFGSIAFAGQGASRLSGLQVNCTSASACVINQSIGNYPLQIENAEIDQNLSGPALVSAGGAVFAVRVRAVSFGAGDAVQLTLLTQDESRFVDCETINAASGSAMTVSGGMIAVVNGKISAAGKGPSASVVGATRLLLRGVSLDSLGAVVTLRNTRTAVVGDSLLTPGLGAPAVIVNNDPVVTFAASKGPGLVIANNVFASDNQSVISCVQPESVMTRGNLIPLYSGLAGVTGFVDGCQRTSFAGF